MLLQPPCTELYRSLLLIVFSYRCYFFLATVVPVYDAAMAELQEEDEFAPLSYSEVIGYRF